MTSYHKPIVGDIVFARNASFGLVAFVNMNIPFCIGQDIVIMTEKRALTKYIFYKLISPLIQTKILNLSAGSTFGRINLKDIRNLIITVPNILEQQKIASIFTSIDDNITCEKVYLNKLHIQKNGLMADLLTGKVRIPAGIAD